VDQQLNGTPGGRAETPAVQEEGQRSPQYRRKGREARSREAQKCPDITPRQPRAMEDAPSAPRRNSAAMALQTLRHIYYNFL